MRKRQTQKKYDLYEIADQEKPMFSERWKYYSDCVTFYSEVMAIKSTLLWKQNELYISNKYISLCLIYCQ